MLNVTFFGVRASARHGGVASRYGVHGRCVALEVPDGDAILIDLGTGAGAWAATVDRDRPVRAHALLSRAHPDHVAGASLFDGEILGPPPGQGPDGTRWTVVEDEDLALGDAKVAVRPVPQLERVNGYRVEWQGVAVAYVPVDPVSELAGGADLLVLDASGHATFDDALLAARQGGAHRVALVGHHPDRDDDDLDRALVEARRAAAGLDLDEVLVASEGTTVSFERGGGR
ncbi:MAG TPA: hypothetical protein VHG90_15735 [Acidimicrobiales bacterium]|nr:hypothetical protein [Acidimicrobiales bacterium]